MLREGNSKRNQSRTKRRKYGKVFNSKRIAHIRAIVARLSPQCKLHANANNTCLRQCEYARVFHNFVAHLSCVNNHSNNISRVFILLSLFVK